MRRSFIFGVALMLIGVAAVGWFYRGELKSRYYTYRLMHASDTEVSAWAKQAGEWSDAVPERLLNCLIDEDDVGCSRAGAALTTLAEQGAASSLSARLSKRFPHFSLPGQQAALDWAASLAHRSDQNLVADCRAMVRTGLQSSDSGVRIRAAALAIRPTIGLADQLVPFLGDPAPEVRRAVILAVGPSRALVLDDDLLHALHDPDAEVRRLTDTALRSRGLRPIDVHLGRLLTDPRPAKRLELVALLRDDGELDLSVWVRRLCDDPVPAVRAAAARLAADQQVFQLTDRLQQMAQADPDLTVRQTAGFHLRQLETPIRPVGATSP